MRNNLWRIFIAVMATMVIIGFIGLLVYIIRNGGIGRMFANFVESICDTISNSLIDYLLN